MTTRWQDRARCRGAGDAPFFPVGTDAPSPTPAAEAIQQATKRRFCYHCPVAAQCLSAALDNGDVYGVFASTPQERRKIREYLGRSAGEHEEYVNVNTEPISA